MLTSLRDLDSRTLREWFLSPETTLTPHQAEPLRVNLAVESTWEGLPALRGVAETLGVELADVALDADLMQSSDAPWIVRADAFPASRYKPRHPQDAPKRLAWHRLVEDDPTVARHANQPQNTCVLASVREDLVGGLARLLEHVDAMATAWQRVERPQVRLVWSAWEPKDGGSPGVALAQALLQGLATLGCDVTLHRPDAFDLEIPVLADAERRLESAGGSLTLDASPPPDVAESLCWTVPWAAVRWYDDAPRERVERDTVIAQEAWPTTPSTWPVAAGKRAVALWLSHWLRLREASET